MGRVLEGREVNYFPSVDLAALDEISGSQSVTIPDVRSIAEGDALSALGERKLIGAVQVEDSYSSAGTVLWQSPEPGTSADAGDTIYIGVSSGTPPPPPKPDPEPEPDPKPKPKPKPKPNPDPEPKPDPKPKPDPPDEPDDGGSKGGGNGDGED